jgi:gliding motility-associated-like protein
VWSVSNEDCQNYDQDNLTLYIPISPIGNDDSLVFSFTENMFIDEIDKFEQINILSNDNYNSSFQSAQIIVAPLNGDAELNDEFLSYTPNAPVFSDNLVYLISDNNCNNLTDSVNVKISIQDFSAEISNGFTPNRDGLNDLFVFEELKDTEAFPNNKLIIHNRWGDIVFEQENYRNTWDGTYQKTNAPLPAGTYYYSLWLDVGEGEIKYGAVVIIR